MSIIKIPVAPWEPDKGKFSTSSLYGLNNLISAGANHVCAPGWAENASIVANAVILNDIATQAGGLHTHLNTKFDTAYTYVGTDKRIVRDSTNTQMAADTAFTFDPQTGWQFVSYGDTIWATNGNQGVDIYRAASPTANFQSGDAFGITYIAAPPIPAGFNPRPKLVSTIKNHLLLANCYIANTTVTASLTAGTTYSDIVMWSATDNPRRFGSPLDTVDPTYVGSDYQILADDYGPITGIIGGDYALIFKPGCIYRMDGPPWTFHAIAHGVGTVAPNSIIRYNEDVYFWGQAGPMVIQGGSGVPMPLMKGKLQNVAYGSLDTKRYTGPKFSRLNSFWTSNRLTSGVIDPVNGLVGWFNGTGMVIYDPTTQEMSCNIMNTMTFGPAKTINIPSISGYTPGTPFGQTRVINQKADTNLSVSNPTYATTKPESIELIWPYMKFGEESSSKINKIRVVYDAIGANNNNGNATNYWLDTTIGISSRSRIPSNDEYTEVTVLPYSDTYQNPEGWVEFPSHPANEYHSIYLKLSGAGADASGVNRPVYAALSLLSSMMYIEVDVDLASKKGSEYGTS